MSRILPALFLASCASPGIEWAERPSDYQAPPSAGTLELRGPDVAVAGEVHTWTILGPDLQIGDRVIVGWGGHEGPGPCYFRGQSPGTPCLDIRDPVRVLVDGTVGTDTEAIFARFNLVTPATSRSEVYLQAMSVDGAESATSEVQRLHIPRAGRCAGSNAYITTAAEYLAYRDCTELTELAIGGDVPVDLSFPHLRQVWRYLDIDGSAIETLDLPVLERLGGLNAGGVSLISLSAPALVEAGGLAFIDAVQLQTVSVPALQTLAQLIVDNTGLPSLSLPLVASINGITIDRSPLTNIELPLLATVGHFSIDRIEHAGTMSLPALTTAATFRLYGNPQLQAVDVPLLSDAYHFDIRDNDSLQTLNAPLFATADYGVDVSRNDVLHTLTLPSLATVSGLIHFVDNPAWCVDSSIDYESIAGGSVTITGNLCN